MLRFKPICAAAIIMMILVTFALSSLNVFGNINRCIPLMKIHVKMYSQLAINHYYLKTLFELFKKVNLHTTKYAMKNVRICTKI